FGHRHRRRAHHGLRPDDQFPAALFRHFHRRLLAALAYLTLHLVSGLSLHSSGRQSRRAASCLSEPDDRLPSQRALAWRGVELCRVGCAPRLLSGGRKVERVMARSIPTATGSGAFPPVAVAWVFFRARSFHDAGYILAHMFNPDGFHLMGTLGQVGLPVFEMAVAFV